jgi:hypothetical protein
METWTEALYDNEETVRRLGNLGSPPAGREQLSVSDRQWPEKRTLYDALDAPSKEKQETYLTAHSNTA